MPPVIATATGRLTPRRRALRLGLGWVGLGLGLGLGSGCRPVASASAVGAGLRLLCLGATSAAGSGGSPLGDGSLGEDVLGQVDRGPRVHRLGAVCARLHRIGVLDALQRQREAPALAVDLDDLHVHRLALRHHLARVLDVMLRELGDVHETLDPRQDLDERAEGDDLRDATFDDVVLVVVLDHLLPRIALGLLEAERDALAVAVDVEHLHLDGLADLEDLRRMVDVRPRELGDVDQAVHAVEVDERAEVDDVRDLPLDDVARLELVEDLLPLLLALFLEHGAARKDDVVA